MDQSLLNILVLDDDPIIRNILKSMLADKAKVRLTEKPSDAFAALKKEPFDILISDFMLPEMDGLEVLKKVRSEYAGIEVIMISAEGDMNTVIGALRQGAVDYFKKPFKSEDIWIAIERTRKYAELNANLNTLKSKTKYLLDALNEKIGESFVGESPGTLDIKKQMQMVAATHDTSVLILGESGTGKELVARGIHKLSSRNDEVFGAVNMSAVPETLFESEFFGHKKGSFTGAIADKAGWFEVANKGTLFFDEIGEMNPSQQVKLLRVLEDRSFTRIGTQKSQSFDIRIIAATNKTIEEMSSGKNFRADLYYRLSTFTIFIPPLRERREDIPQLIDYFFNMLTNKMGKSLRRVHPDAVTMLYNYQFPGNIRELKNMMERAIIICEGNEIIPANFPDLSPSRKAAGMPDASYVNGPMGAAAQINGEQSEEIYDLKELEKNVILRALEKADYNKNEAARLLNIEWNALYRRMQKYGIK